MTKQEMIAHCESEWARYMMRAKRATNPLYRKLDLMMADDWWKNLCAVENDPGRPGRVTLEEVKAMLARYR